MPVRCDVFHPDRTAIGVAEGTVDLRDLEGFLDDLEKVGALQYDKVFVATMGEANLSDSDWTVLSQRLATYLDNRALGALAIVGATSGDDSLAAKLAALRSGRRPAKVFRSIHDARQWLFTKSKT